VSGVFLTIDPPPPLHPSSVSYPRTRRAVRGWRVNILEDARQWIGLLQYSIIYLNLAEAKWFQNTHPETIEEEPLIIELEVEDLMVVWPDGLVYPVTFAVRSHIVELNN
jgi:hypothetical protein